MKSKFFSPITAMFLAVAMFACTAATVRAEVEDKITKSFPVESGGQLVVEVDRGAIEVNSADVSVVSIEVIRKAGGSRSTAEQTLKDHVVTTTQNGNKVELHAEHKGAKLGGWFGSGTGLQVNCRITVPRKFDANLKTAGGSIGVAGLTGQVQAHTSGGSLKFEKIEGPLTGHTSGGSVTVTAVKGNVEIKTSGGSLTLNDIEGDVSATTSGGSIRADKLTGNSVVKTSGGSIEVAGIKGKIEARTSGGSINADLQGQPTGDCIFKTSAGSVTVVLGEKVAVDVDARTSAGRVSADFPVTIVASGEQTKSALRGKINGGGPLITAHTSAGSVRLKKS